MEELFRYCSKCNEKIFYKNIKYLEKAEQKNSLCRNCNHKLWLHSHFNTKCTVCGVLIYRLPKSIEKDKPVFCTYGCRNKYYSGEKSFAWKGGREHTKLRNRKNDKLRKIRYKLKAVKLLGEKCSRCGYGDCIAALDFHHSDSDKKDFTIKNIIACSWEKIEKEIKKCILLCANCHRKLHWEENGNMEELYEVTKEK